MATKISALTLLVLASIAFFYLSITYPRRTQILTPDLAAWKSLPEEDENEDLEGPLDIYKKCHGDKPVRNVVYVGIQKTGSTTLRTIFHQYAYAHNLTTCMDTTDESHLSWPSPIEISHVLKLRNTKCDMIAEEMVYDKDLLDKMTNPGRKYITSVRDPIKHFVSAFKHIDMYGLIAAAAGKTRKELSFDDAMRVFLRDPTIGIQVFEMNDNRRARSRYDSFLLYPNLQLYDLGIQSPESMQARELKRAIRSRLKEFSAVVIPNQFEKSLVLLQDALCWKDKDLFYIALNTRGGQKKTQPAMPADLIRMIERYHRYDVIMYRIVKREFDKAISGYRGINQRMAEMNTSRYDIQRKCDTEKNCLPFFMQAIHRQNEIAMKRMMKQETKDQLKKLIPS